MNKIISLNHQQKKLSEDQRGLVPLLVLLIGAIVIVIIVAYIRVHKANH